MIISLYNNESRDGTHPWLSSTDGQMMLWLCVPLAALESTLFAGSNK